MAKVVHKAVGLRSGVPRLPVPPHCHHLMLVLDANSKEPFFSASEEKEILSAAENRFPRMILLSVTGPELLQCRIRSRTALSWVPLSLACRALPEMAPLKILFRDNEAHGLCERKCSQGFR